MGKIWTSDEKSNTVMQMLKFWSDASFFMDYSNLLNDDESLVRKTQFEVHRQNSRIVIDCIEVIEGKGAAKFVAIPYLDSRGNAKKEFYGFGDTEKESLCDCLAKIKDVPVYKF